MTTPTSHPTAVAVIGGGPAGLMAAEIVALAGHHVTVFERMPSPGRKLLMAGRGGLNLTHSEKFAQFLARYAEAAGWLAPILAAFPPEAVTAWCEGLGQPSFIGSSGRVFPKAMKASPLLRAWLARLDGLGVRLVTRAHWIGRDADGTLHFADGAAHRPDAAILALGGASWPRLGGDGSWAGSLPGIAITPLRPANCGFAVDWSSHFRDRHAGTPLKRIALRHGGRSLRGEAMVTGAGLEGGAIYALSAALRDAIAREGLAMLEIDLRPDLTQAELARRLGAPRGSASLSGHLKRHAGLPPVAVGLLQEALHQGATTPLPALIKAVPVTLTAPFGLLRAISTAGGIGLDELDDRLMLKRLPGLFAAGEMLDWEAPTGGYLLTACLATGHAAGRGAAAWLAG
ncbi:MAG: TIGR03862 family flavoprotein [Acetobacteraceae bacterium]|nr:TIGR03862 family flavoprotein [Acetobacteraceae bacterium]